MPGPLVAIPIALGGVALVRWLARIGTGSPNPSWKGPQGETYTSIPAGPNTPPLPVYKTNDVFPVSTPQPPAPPPPPKPAPELPPPVVAKVEPPIAPPPAPVLEEKPAAPVVVSPPPVVAPPPVTPVVAPPPPVVSAPPAVVAPPPPAAKEPPAVELPPAAPPPPSPPPELPAPEPAPVATQPEPPPPPAPVTAPVPADVASKPVGYDPALAAKLAKGVADNLQKSAKWAYDRKKLKAFQLAAGIPDDGLYGPESKSALAFYGIKRPPLAQFKGADGTYADVAYRWA